ncbi:MAG TPA: MoxR family ATPase [Syntrophales bacterium]|nr:MoxR family ATPase [Syntrophales bacterium]
MLNPDLQEAMNLYKTLKTEADKGVIGLDSVKDATFIAFMSEIPTTLNTQKNRRANAGLVWYRGVPGVGKTYMVLVLAKATESEFVRIQGRADLTPGDIVGVEIFNPKTGEWEKRPGPVVRANILLLDEGNRISPKSQSAFLEVNQDRAVTLGDYTFALPEFYFAVMTTNPVETGEGTFPLSAANADRFTFLIDVGYLSPGEERRLVDLDLKAVEILPLVKPERVIELRSAIANGIQLHESLKKYIRRLVRATRPYNPGIQWYERSPSPLVEEFVELGASPRATIAWGPTSRARALFVRGDNRVLPEDIQALAKNILTHRINLKSRARKAGVTVEDVISEIVERVPIP